MMEEKCSPVTERSSTFPPPTPSTRKNSASNLLKANYDEEAATTTPQRRNRLLAALNTRWKKTSEEKERSARRDDEIAATEVLKLEECTEGYSRTAAFLSSETNFSLYRGFNYLHSRVLLNLQDELVVLEKELLDLDAMQQINGEDMRLKSRRSDKRISRREQGTRNRQAILSEIQSKLGEYGDVLKKARDVASFQKPSTRDYRSIRTWFWNNTPFIEREMEFIKRQEDIITLHSGREWSTFDAIVEKFLMSLNSSFLRRMFTTPDLRRKTEDKHIRYFSRSRVECIVGLIITSVIFVLLVVPVVVMYKLTSVSRSQHSMFTAIAVLIVFTLLFSGAMNALTVARRHEIFAASAAYCAILVVFISNFSIQAN